VASFFKRLDDNNWLMCGVLLTGIVVIVCVFAYFGVEMPLVIR
jgi:hypothetical protein